MIDVHCHLNFDAFKNDYDAAIQKAQKSGVEIIINTGTKLDSSKRAVELAQDYENLYAIVGVHPHHADKVELGSSWLDELKTIATSSKKVVGIGEIGLDNYRYQSNGIVDPITQKEIFISQLELAHQLRLPIQIHNRHAGQQILEILELNKHLLQPIPG